VSGDLVLPDGAALTVPEATTLRFEPGAVLLCTGRLDLLGAADAPVRLVPRQKSWGGVAVLGAPMSAWRDAEVAGAAGVSRPGWVTGGGVTFCKSPVRLERCRFVGSAGPCALRVVYGRVECRGSLFRESRGDGLVVEFAAGGVERCVFVANGGAAIRAAGSVLRLHDVSVEQGGRFGVACGRESHVTGSSLRIEGARVGVTSTDLSAVELTRSTVRGAAVGLAACELDRAYGPAVMEARDITFEDVAAETQVEPRSQVVLEGEVRGRGPVDRALIEGTQDSEAEPAGRGSPAAPSHPGDRSER
jgi:hypothetical protein